MSTPQPPERDEDTGRYASGTRETVYEAMPRNGEPMRARDVSEKTDVPRTTVNYHLNKLHKSGRVKKKKFHEKRVVWWIDEDGADAGADEQPQAADA